MVSKFNAILLTTIIFVVARDIQASQVVLSGSDSALYVMGGLFQLTCTVELGVDSLQRIAWYHNGTEIASQGRVVITPGGDGSSNLDVTSIQRADGGEYRCEAFFTDSLSVTSGIRTITVSGIFSVQVDGDIEVISGTTAQLRCVVEAVPDPVLKFKRVVDGTFFEPTEKKQPNIGILERTFTVEDDGEWRCVVSNTIGGEEESITVNVLYSPENAAITQPSPNPPRRGMDFELSCNSSGNPAASYTWIHNGINNLTQLSLESSGSRFTVDTNTGHLHVNGTTYGDAGTYTCIATNEYGSVSVNATISVEGAPQILLDPAAPSIKGGRSLPVYLDCPFISNPLPSSVEWRKGSTLLQSSGGKYTIFQNNGTLRISNLDESGTYTCTVINGLGRDSGSFGIMVVDVPNAPTNFIATPFGSDDRAANVTWTVPADANNLTRAVEDYVIEYSINGGHFQLSDVVFGRNITHGLLKNLNPGEEHIFRLRARNIAGLSQPSNTQIYTPPASAPSLSFFNVIPLEDGRSVMLKWQLEYVGGPGLTEFNVQVMMDSVLVRTIKLNSSLESFIVTDLAHETRYAFLASLTNNFGLSAAFNSTANTTIAAPSKPTKPDIIQTTTNSIKLSFSVEFGSQPITHFYLNVTQSDSGSELQKTFSIEERKYVESLTEKTDEATGVTIGYDVVMFVTGLSEREKYEFEVAAESSIGMGEFSEPSESTRLEDDRIIYYIVGSVVVGVLLVVIVIVFIALFAYGKQRYNQRKKTLTINSNNRRFPLDYTDAMQLSNTNPTVSRQQSRETIKSTTNSYYSNGHLGHSSLPRSEPYDHLVHSSLPRSELYDRNITSSPAYNRLGESPAPSGMTSPLGYKTDSVIDMPENSGHVQTHFVEGKVALNPQYNVHHLGNHSPRPHHMHLMLQTSLNDIQYQTNSPTPDRYPESLSSERQFLGNPHLLGVHAPVLSRSNPTIGNRYTCDSMLLPSPTSQATDV